MPEETAVEVLICGAGASGLTLAIDLARRGVTVRLVEQLAQPFLGSRGKGIQPRTQEIFEDLGVLDRLFARGGLYPPAREHRKDGSTVDAQIMEDTQATASEPYRKALMVPQFLSEETLRERLLELGQRPEFGCQLVGLKQDEHGVSARLLDSHGERTVRARYLVGADGGRSFVRRTLGIGFPGETLGVRALVADVHLRGLPRDAWHRFNSDDMARQLALCPLAGTDLFQVQAPIALEGEVDLSASGLSTVVAERSGRADIHIDSVAWASAYQMNKRLADQYRVGRVFLVGDAAHVHPPTGGQGLNTSVQDAYNLGWKLAAALGGAPDTLLDSYEQERRPIAEGMLGLSTKLLNEMKQGALRRGREVQQLDLGYRESSLALHCSEHDAPVRAGDRAPDASVEGAAGQATRLFSLFAGPHWTLLGYQVESDLAQPRAGLHIHTFGSHGDLLDPSGHAQKAYGLAVGEWLLVRPDGYIGARVHSAQWAALEAYLQKVGLRAAGLEHG